MSLTGGSKFILTGGATNYQIARSLRFRASNSAYLSRTPSASNRKTWTWSGWVKRDQTVSGGVGDNIFGCHAATTDAGRLLFFFGSSSGFTADAFYISGHSTDWRVTTQLFRDFAGWYHIVVAWDTTQSTAANRVKLYVNGTQVTSFATSNDPTLNADYGINQASAHYLGTGYNIAGSAISGPMDGYLSEVNFIDGQALTPSSFGQTDATTGAWNPIKYTGTYGTNGFYLPFSDNSAATSTTIGKDFSGNGNNWTPSGISVTAGVTNDSLVDTPTNYGSDTGAGGEVRGNYCTFNPLKTTATLTDGNLHSVFGNVNTSGMSTFYMTSGKWYWEGTVDAGSTVSNLYFGIANDAHLTSANIGADANSWSYRASSSGISKSVTGGIETTYGATYTAGDVIGVALDLTAGTLVFYKNGVSQGTAFTGLVGPVCPATGSAPGGGTSGWQGNFGQRPFAYTAPSGFKALCTQNLPDPAIVKPSPYMDVNTRTGTGAAFSVTGKLFQPDIIWTKNRTTGSDHAITDSQFGTGKYWSSNQAAAYVSDAQAVTAFNSDGFSGGTAAIINTTTSSAQFVDWLFKESVTAGIDLVKFSGNSTNRTIAHSLGVAPSMLIVKRDGANGAVVWHNNLTSSAYYLALDTTAAQASDAGAFNSTAPTSSVFSVGTNNNTNATGTNNMLAMLFTDIAGFSKFGSYTGNGSADGPFVWCGFRPRFIMVKRTDSTGNWYIKDTARDTYNPAINGLYGNLNNAEDQDPTGYFDLLSNGFKARGAYGTMNASGGTYIFAAFAESPFKTARAR